MNNSSLVNRCYTNTNSDNDTFVGIKCENNDYSIHFPLGFEFSSNEKVLRKEIFLLINCIANTIGHKASIVNKMDASCNYTAFPIQAALYIINDFIARGYYVERETLHKTAKQGKINWNRTIKTQKAFVSNHNVFYLDFIVNKNQINENELITAIHKWCVYDSFRKIGWLFTDSLPEKPEIKFNKKLFLTIIKEKLSNTFNDRNRLLFANMVALIEYDGSDQEEYKYGTTRFEYVWEALIDKTFGIRNKDRYFPKTKWILRNNKINTNASLEPDTIMIYKDDIYVLDAKYYKYGVTNRVADLPESTSINKQITYGEYVAENNKFTVEGKKCNVYNAFLLPFSSMLNQIGVNEEYYNFGTAIGEWKSNTKSYEMIKGILVDVKHLMKISSQRDSNEIIRLAECITSNQ